MPYSFAMYATLHCLVDREKKTQRKRVPLTRHTLVQSPALVRLFKTAYPKAAGLRLTSLCCSGNRQLSLPRDATWILDQKFSPRADSRRITRFQCRQLRSPADL